MRSNRFAVMRNIRKSVTENVTNSGRNDLISVSFASEIFMKLINIGFGNMISASRLITIVSPESAPIKRIIQDAKDKGMLIDATYGRRTRAVIIMDSDHVILSAVQPETVAGRLGDDVEEVPEDE